MDDPVMSNGIGPPRGKRSEPGITRLCAPVPAILSSIFLTAVLTVLLFSVLPSFCFEPEPAPPDDFFLAAGHASNGRAGYWYDRNRGGLEVLTGIPYDNMSCRDCHMACGECHTTRSRGEFYYSAKSAGGSSVCIECHPRQWAELKDSEAKGEKDAHGSAGMSCVDCHDSMLVLDDPSGRDDGLTGGLARTGCEGCHPAESRPEEHLKNMHEGRLDCRACHVREVTACTNCHIETLVRTGTKMFIPEDGWVFLMNEDDKVTSATMENFITGEGKTLVMFAPRFSHSIRPRGRGCDECHDTAVVREAALGRLLLTWMEGAEQKNRKGVVPVVEGVEYDCSYMLYKKGSWMATPANADPRIQYAGFGSPLTDEQFDALATPWGAVYSGCLTGRPDRPHGQ